MHKTIIVSIILVVAWLIANALHVPDILVNFLLVGALPNSTVTLSPSMMLAIMTACGGIIIFELLARRFSVLRKTRYHFTHLTAKQKRLPKRRFTRA